MNLSCSSKMIKYLMFAFNLFFVISGIIIIAVGATVKTVYTEYEDFLSYKYFSLPNMLIATGAFIFVISFFGCCGAIKESWIMLGIFSILLCIIFIFEFACGIAGYVLRDQTASYLEETLRQNIKTYNNGTGHVWDLIQSTVISSKRKRREVIDDTTTTAVTPNGPSTTQPYSQGCVSAFGNYIRKHAVQIGGCAMGLAIVQILGIAFSCHLVRQLKNGYYST
ncbi:hypothetical protein ABEB36_014959 [Hypothenemus hampei]|uniref:Tetraspanin n=1 Tax=Hypothenemus hampei TaxID=57062 RepID=A0ABD1E1F2_HYPHA